MTVAFIFRGWRRTGSKHDGDAIPACALNCTRAESPRRGGWLRSCGSWVAMATVCWLTALSVTAQSPKPTEYQVKAAYLSDLGRFVEAWGSQAKPASDEPFNICVLGQDPFGGSLDAAIKGENIAGAPLSARRIAKPQDAQGCQVLFISSSEEGQLSAVLAALGNSPVLTVSEIPGFVRRGGMVEFVLDGNRVRFEINIAASGRAGLSLSSDLLKVARAVRRTP